MKNLAATDVVGTSILYQPHSPPALKAILLESATAMSGAQSRMPSTTRLTTHGLVIAAYLAVAVASTWPLATDLDDSLPQGTGASATVPLVSAWSLWWVSDRVGHGFAGLWDAPIFHPVKSTFAFSETILLGGVMSAPVQWLGGSPALAHNLFLLLTLVLNGWTGFLLLRATRVEPWIAGLGGAVVLMLPYVHYELGVLTLVPTWGIAWTLLACKRLAAEPRPMAGVSLGLAAASTALLCAHYALFVALIVGPASLILFGRRLVDREVLRALAVAVGTAGLLAGPSAWAQLAAADRNSFERTLERAQMGAASLGSWLTVPWGQLFNPPFVVQTTNPEVMALFPGTLKVVLGVGGLALALGRRRQRRWLAFLTAVGVAGLLLSSAARMEVAGFHPYEALKQAVPGLGQARSLWRAGLFAQLVLGLGTALALQAGVDAARRARGSELVRRLAIGGVAAVGVLAVVEVWPARQTLTPVPLAVDYRSLRGWIDVNLPADLALLPLPQPAVPAVDRFEPTARWMYATAFHGRPLVVGYSSFVPRATLRLVRQIGGCPKPDAYRRIAARPVALVVETSWLRAQPDCAPPPDSWQAVHVDAGLQLTLFVSALPEPGSDVTRPAGSPSP